MANSGDGAQSSSSPRRGSVWRIDSAATSHKTFDRSAFGTYTLITPFSVQVGDSSTSSTVDRGTVRLSIMSNGRRAVCELRNVRHIPSFVYSLVSVTTPAKHGLVVQFHEDIVKISRGGKTVPSGMRDGGLYTLDLSTPSQSGEIALAAASLQRWHERMGHVHQAGVLEMARNQVVSSMVITPGKRDAQVCEACISGKLHRSPIPRASATRAEGLLDLVHTDIAGPFPVPSKGGALSFVTFIDDRSRWLTVFLIKSKSDCFSCFLKFRSHVENQIGRKIMAIRSDGGWRVSVERV